MQHRLFESPGGMPDSAFNLEVGRFTGVISIASSSFPRQPLTPVYVGTHIQYGMSQEVDIYVQNFKTPVTNLSTPKPPEELDFIGGGGSVETENEVLRRVVSSLVHMMGGSVTFNYYDLQARNLQVMHHLDPWMLSIKADD